MAAKSATPASDAAVDVLVLGEHPAASFAAALLAQGGKLNVLHVVPPRATPLADRLVWINPACFALSPLLAPLRDTLPATPSFGLQFLTAEPAVRSGYQSKSPVALVARYGALRAAMGKIEKAAGVRCVSPRQVSIARIDETGLSLQLGKSLARAKLLVISDGVPDGQEPTLGLHTGWSVDVRRRYTSVRCPASVLVPTAGLPTISMSLNLDGAHHWAWLLRGDDEAQLTVEQPAQSTKPAAAESSKRSETAAADRLLADWVKHLQAAGVLRPGAVNTAAHRFELTLPVAGALAEEAVANRTLLIGPAGGFLSACGEEIYPACWSALFAEKVARKALRERHLQDALQPYRHVWRTTLGEYLRGPRDNLPFLLSMAYRNPVLTDRLAEAILQGKPVVR